MNKIAQKLALSLLSFGAFESAIALDSGAQDLTTAVGATDYFKINCAGSDDAAISDTDHLNFQLFKDSVDETPSVESIKPQILNATLTIKKLTTTVSEIAAGTNKEIILNGSNGSYVLKLDTIGTNLTLTNSQTYSVQYQCLNLAGDVTAGTSALGKLDFESKNLKLANKKTAKYSISCKKNKLTGDSYALKVTLFNKTPVARGAEATRTSNLTAQVIKGSIAQNTIGDVLDVQGSNGSYDVMVNSPTNKALSYHFQYSCLNAKNVETKTTSFQIIQDQ